MSSRTVPGSAVMSQSNRVLGRCSPRVYICDVEGRRRIVTLLRVRGVCHDELYVHMDRKFGSSLEYSYMDVDMDMVAVVVINHNETSPIGRSVASMI